MFFHYHFELRMYRREKEKETSRMDRELKITDT